MNGCSGRRLGGFLFDEQNPRRREGGHYRIALATLAMLVLSSCTVGPDYHRPEQHMPTTYKSANTQESTTQPSIASDWWQIFDDPQLDALEQSALDSSPDLQAAMARVTQARAAARIVQSDFYPIITLDPSISRDRTPGSSNNNNSSGTSRNNNARTRTTVRIPLDLSYEVDIWGKIRRNYESANAQLRATQFDYEVVLQTLQADIASNYFTYRSLAAQEQILARTVESYRQQISLTQRALRAGIVGPTDSLQADALLQATIARQIDTQRQIRDTEHALAILLGRAPSELSLQAEPLDLDYSPPMLPAGLPSDLLKRRPDVAVAEQDLVAANAQIGVAQALFYPSLNLTGTAGFESFDVRHALDWEQRIWSIGADAVVPLLEGGRLNANLQQAKARYDELRANYRSAVLSAIRDVEDALTDLHLRADQSAAQQQAVASSREYLRLSQVQYQRGLISYLQVIDAERTLQANEVQAVQILNDRVISTIVLIKSLGGGWNSDASQTTSP